MDDQQRGKCPSHCVRQASHTKNDGDDDPHPDEWNTHERQRVAKGAHISDADSRPGQRQDQRRQRIEDFLPGSLVRAMTQCRNSHGDADRYGDARIEEAVKDEFGVSTETR